MSLCRVILGRTIMGAFRAPGDELEIENEVAVEFLCDHGVIEKIPRKPKRGKGEKPRADGPPV